MKVKIINIACHQIVNACFGLGFSVGGRVVALLLNDGNFMELINKKYKGLLVI